MFLGLWKYIIETLKGQIIRKCGEDKGEKNKVHRITPEKMPSRQKREI